MKIFILEDNEDRIIYFRQLFIDHDLFVATTAREAILALDGTTEFDLIFLDHDLGGEQMVDMKNTNTGSEVVRYLVTIADKVNSIIFLHTQNPVAARAMRCTLKENDFRVFIKPFTSLYTEYPL